MREAFRGSGSEPVLKCKVEQSGSVDNGIVPMDNNLIENAIRPFAVGRKNRIFSVAPRGAESSALFYSLIEIAKING
jgi:hypothetical protein